jgi:DNA primase catalytic core
MTVATVTAAGPDLGRLRAATAAAVDFYRAQLSAADRLHTYLHQRGLQALVNRGEPWQIGYAPGGGRHLTRHLRSAGFSDEELVAAGLCHRDRTDPGRLYDVFRDRLVFPVRDEHGPVGFTGRAAPHAPADVPKYVNTAGTALYDKSSLLFGLAEQRDRIAQGWPIALVEGPTDVLACWLSYARTGEPGVVALAPCGTALTDAQAGIVCALPGAQHAVIAAFDGDDAGRTAISKAWQLLHTRLASRQLRAAVLPPGTDPAALLARRSGRAQVRAVLRVQTRPLLEAVAEQRLNGWLARWPRLLQDVGGRCEAARGLIDLMFQAGDSQEAVRVAALIARLARVHPEVVAHLAVDHVATVVETTTAAVADRPAAPGPGPPGQAFPRLHLAGARLPRAGGSDRPAAAVRPVRARR